MSFQHSLTSKNINLVTYKMPHVASVAINIMVKVGSRDENLDEFGIAHFLEHMAFKGTKSRSARQIANEFDLIGGHFNAYTSKENTVYYAKILAKHTYVALNILADILQNSEFNEEEITKEYNVICQEIAENNDNPDDFLYEKFNELIFTDQPLGRSILGTKETIKKFDKESFIKFTNKHYSTGNIIISLAGAVDHDQTLKYVEELFTNLSNNLINNENNNLALNNFIGGYSFIPKTLEQTSIAIGFESVAYNDLGLLYKAQLLSIILGGGISSRLFQKIREELGLAYSVSSWITAYKDTGIFNLHLSLEHSKVNEALDHIKREIQNIINEINDEELIRAKAQIESSLLMAQEKPEFFADDIARNYSLFGKYINPRDLIYMINNYIKDDITNIAEKIFNSKYAIAIMGPDEAVIEKKLFEGLL